MPRRTSALPAAQYAGATDYQYEETSMSTYTQIDAAIDGFLNTTPWAMDLLQFFLAGLP